MIFWLMKLYTVIVQALHYILKTTDHLASLLRNIEESRQKNKTYLNQYKAGIKSLARELDRIENELHESKSKFEDLSNPEPGHLRIIHFNLALTA